MEAQQEAAAGRKPVARTLTVGEMVTEYMGAKRSKWADRTAWQNEALYLRHMAPHLAHLKAAGVEAKTLRAYFETLKAGGLGYSGRRQIHALLSGAYKHAVTDGQLRDNPAHFGRPVRGKDEAAKEKDTFTPEEARRFLSAALEDRWALLLAFLLLSGMRIGEAVALTWGDYGNEEGAAYVTVSKARGEFMGRAYQSEGKTAASRRRVYLPEGAAAVIEDMRGRVMREAEALDYQGQGVRDDAPLFPRKTGQHHRQDTARDSMRRTCLRAGVPLLSPHALRHTFATHRLAEGFDPVTVSKHLGHAQVSTTLNFYAHKVEGNLRDMARQMGQARGTAKAEAGQAVPTRDGDAPQTGEDENVRGQTAKTLPRALRARKGGPRRK
jgi:integrase